MEEEIERLTRAIAHIPTAALYMSRARLLWRLQRHAAAMADFEKAAAMEGPGSGAAAALQMARDVLDYRNTDMLNP